MGPRQCLVTLWKGMIIKAHKGKSNTAEVCVAVISQVIKKNKRGERKPEFENRIEGAATGDLKW